MGFGRKLKKFFSPDPRLGGISGPLSPSQSGASPIAVQATTTTEQQAPTTAEQQASTTTEQQAPKTTEQQSATTTEQHAPPSDQGQVDLTRQPSQLPSPQASPGSPKQSRTRKVSSAPTPPHIAKEYEIMERNIALDSERSRAHGIAGLGSDAAAAAGASLQEVHQAHSREGGAAGGAANKGAAGVGRVGSMTRKKPPPIDPEKDTGNTHPPTTSRSVPSTSSMPAGTSANGPSSSRDAFMMNVPGNHDKKERAGSRRHIERHIHHVQHHIQPIVITEELPQEAKRNGIGKEPAGVDEMPVAETVYHHIYHVVEPVIQKEAARSDRIHTTSSMHQVIHQAPIVQRTQNQPISMEQFLEGGGKLPDNLSRQRPQQDSQAQASEQDVKKREIPEEEPAAEAHFPQQTTDTGSVD
ncbi:hypothetical protein CVT26_003635 [Gymnopilus dilepis]|uniref:Uncharacterized protein n=1 Tax=Gymnopilus dilepis TaxID=231916 RepID=A0A409VR71_9AGAR|nr:hypothetical protein CVT26_003635 [Gymnopilus dilepis]